MLFSIAAVNNIDLVKIPLGSVGHSDDTKSVVGKVHCSEMYICTAAGHATTVCQLLNERINDKVKIVMIYFVSLYVDSFRFLFFYHSPFGIPAAKVGSALWQIVVVD